MSVSQRCSLQLQTFSYQSNLLLQTTATLDTCGNIAHGRQRVCMFGPENKSPHLPTPSPECLSISKSLLIVVVHALPMQRPQRVRMTLPQSHTLPFMTLHQQRQVT
eukprot:EC791663.1.p3 GENE.EC791663.1~~EC791663.1.p3  ORF type:complete len:106 (-),score=8.42 EC791663.1:184-501(-)